MSPEWKKAQVSSCWFNLHQPAYIPLKYLHLHLYMATQCLCSAQQLCRCVEHGKGVGHRETRGPTAQAQGRGDQGAEAASLPPGRFNSALGCWHTNGREEEEAARQGALPPALTYSFLACNLHCLCSPSADLHVAVIACN